MRFDSAAAGCLAGQLHNFVTSRNITDLVVLTHSNGGNVALGCHGKGASTGAKCRATSRSRIDVRYITVLSTRS